MKFWKTVLKSQSIAQKHFNPSATGNRFKIKLCINVKLPAFEGPFDLLLHLIKENEVNIYDIPVAKITEEYLKYIQMMEILDLNIAGEFIVMAATLIHIKSKMLLPVEKTQEGEEIDHVQNLFEDFLNTKNLKKQLLIFQN